MFKIKFVFTIKKKVIVDRRHNRHANTGAFELIYKSVPVHAPHFHGLELKVEGSSVKKPIQPSNNNTTIPNNNDNTNNNSKPKQEPPKLKLDPVIKPVEKQQTPANGNGSFEAQIDKIEKALSASHATSSTHRLVDNVTSTINNDKVRSNTTMPSLHHPSEKKYSEKAPPTMPPPQLKIKKELTCAPISIATSIHELAHKGMSLFHALQ